MKSTALLFVTVFTLMNTAFAEGLVHVPSNFSVAQTSERLEKILRNKGMTIFNRIKHSQSAREVGVDLRPTELFIFGNPKVGSPMMHCMQTVAIDLPQKALIWQDKQDKVWISYNSPQYLKSRHNIAGCEDILAKVEKALSGITGKAAAP